jgi:hypothetical protein
MRGWVGILCVLRVSMATFALKHYFPPGIEVTGMGKKLSEAETARYERDGFVFPVEAFSADEACSQPEETLRYEAAAQ